MQSGYDESISPVTEVYLYEQKEHMRNTLARRRDERLSELYAANVAAKPQEESSCAPINLVSEESEDSGDTTFDYDSLAPDAAAASGSCSSNTDASKCVPIATPVPVATYYAPNVRPGRSNNSDSVSQTLVALFDRIRQNGDTEPVDFAPCKHDSCPFCTTPLMQQRYELAKRLLQLEKQLYGV